LSSSLPLRYIQLNIAGGQRPPVLRSSGSWPISVTGVIDRYLAATPSLPP
jgi:hypothetical protein